jgi:hypothetical protein
MSTVTWTLTLSLLITGANNLTHIPPAFAWLVNLRDLNISANQLEYLPAEMLGMPNLAILTMTGNPFWDVPELEPVPADDHEAASPMNTMGNRDPWEIRVTTHDRPVSAPTYILGHTPPLTELCIRALIAPYSPQGVSDSNSNTHNINLDAEVPARMRSRHDPRLAVPTNIAMHYELIQPGETRMESGLIKLIVACAPGAVAKSTSKSSPSKSASSSFSPSSASTSKEKGDENGKGKSKSKAKATWRAQTRDLASRYRTPPSWGLCPSPSHDSVRHPFFYHAEERFSWENRVGLVNLGTQRVPFLWRGCARRCLDFLLEEGYVAIPVPQPVPKEEMQVHRGTVTGQISGLLGMGMEVDRSMGGSAVVNELVFDEDF